jgi:Mn-dependent DtxR family transcriptional regulator
MRKVLGTTNKEERFKENELVEFCEDEYVVLKNYGSRGRVRMLNTHMVIDPFYWEFQGMAARRVKTEG